MFNINQIQALKDIFEQCEKQNQLKKEGIPKTKKKNVKTVQENMKTVAEPEAEKNFKAVVSGQRRELKQIEKNKAFKEKRYG